MKVFANNPTISLPATLGRKARAQPDNRATSVAQRKLQNTATCYSQRALPTIQCRASPIGSQRQQPIQRATASINYSITNGTTRQQVALPGTPVGMYGQGGISHSEQAAWSGAAGTLTQALESGRTVEVTFAVDTLICDGCAPWLENTVWQQLNDSAQRGNGQFRLFANVNGNRVEIDSNRTIWTPEVAEVSTFDRLNPAERDLLFLEQHRNAAGALTQEQYDSHLDTNVQNTLDAVTNFSFSALNYQNLSTWFDEAKAQAYADNYFQYTEEQEVIEDFVHNLTLYQAIKSSLFAIPQVETGLPGEVEEWRREFIARIRDWAVFQMESELTPETGDCPHYANR